MESIKIKEIDVREFACQFDRAINGHFAVKPRDLFIGTVLPFDILFPAVNQEKRDVFLRVLFREGRTYDQSQADWMLQERIEDIYINQDKENSYLEYLSENIKKLIHSPDVPSEKKTILLYDSAESIVSKVFRERPSRANVELGCDLIENLAVHLTLDSVSSDALLRIFSKDYYTFTHSVQVAMLGMAFCNYLQWGKDAVIDFGIGALFHDVGKSHIQDEILNKPGRLTKDEFEIIKKHTVLGYHQLKNTQIMSKIQLNVPLSHHESMDGTGYPQALRGDRIHKYARVARIIDCYDALTTERPYKDALTGAKALEIMGGEMGSTFDRRLLEAFVGFLGSGDKTQEIDQGKRLNLELGHEVHVKFGEDHVELKLSLMGMKTDELLILHVPAGLNLRDCLCEGKTVTARYIQAGVAYQFASTVLGHVTHPVPFVLLSYPKRIEIPDKQREARHECLVRADVRIRDDLFQGVILNTSNRGCKLVLKLSEAGSPPELDIGERVEITTRPDNGRSSESVRGVVRNLSLAKGKALLGVQFDERYAEG